jgi:hypothetical protein
MGLKLAHGLRHSAQQLATCGRPERRLGHGLAAQPSRRGDSRRAETRRVLCALKVRSPCAARARAVAVSRSTAAWWGLADGMVLPTTTGGAPGWRQAGGVEAGLTPQRRKPAAGTRGLR